MTVPWSVDLMITTVSRTWDCSPLMTWYSEYRLNDWGNVMMLRFLGMILEPLGAM